MIASKANELKDNAVGTAMGVISSKMGAQVTDAQVAQYILGELANGNSEYFKAFSKTFGGLHAEVNSEIQTEAKFAAWDKIKSWFSRK